MIIFNALIIPWFSLLLVSSKTRQQYEQSRLGGCHPQRGEIYWEKSQPCLWLDFSLVPGEIIGHKHAK